MFWEDLTGNQAISGRNLLAAVRREFFIPKNGNIPNNNKCLTRDQISSMIYITPLYGNKLALKQELSKELPTPYISQITWLTSDSCTALGLTEDIFSMDPLPDIFPGEEEGPNFFIDVSGDKRYPKYQNRSQYILFVRGDWNFNNDYYRDYEGYFKYKNRKYKLSYRRWWISLPTHTVPDHDYPYSYDVGLPSFEITNLSSCTSYYIINQNQTYAYDQYSSANSCSVATQVGNIYTINSNGLVSVGDEMYSDSNGTYLYPLGYYSYIESGQRVWIRLQLRNNSEGISAPYISEKGNCSSVKNFSVSQSARRLVLSANDGVINASLNVTVYYTVTDQNGNTSSQASKLITLNGGASSVNSTNITGNAGDTININNITFNPASTDGYTLYVNGYSGNVVDEF